MNAALDIPRLDTPRLVLRAPENRDFPAYAAFAASDRARFVGGPLSRRGALAAFMALNAHWAGHGFGRWIVADRSTDEALGLVGLHFPDHWPEPEIAWTLFGGAEGRGIAAEAALAARAFAYGPLGWTTAVSLCDAANARSLALARRLGCAYEADHRHPDCGLLQIWRHPGPGARP